MSKRTSVEANLTNEVDEVAQVTVKKRMVEPVTNSEMANNDNESQIENLRLQAQESLKALLQIDPHVDAFGTFGEVLRNLGNMTTGRANNEILVADSEWGKTKLERIHKVISEINDKVEDIIRKRAGPHLHEHTSPNCTLCQGCLIHLEEAIHRRQLPYFEDIITHTGQRFNNNLYRGKRGNPRFSRGGRGDGGLGSVDERRSSSYGGHY